MTSDMESSRPPSFDRLRRHCLQAEPAPALDSPATSPFALAFLQSARIPQSNRRKNSYCFHIILRAFPYSRDVSSGLRAIAQIDTDPRQILPESRLGPPRPPLLVRRACPIPLTIDSAERQNEDISLYNTLICATLTLVDNCVGVARSSLRAFLFSARIPWRVLLLESLSRKSSLY